MSDTSTPARFLERYQGLVWKIARSFARSSEDRDDLAQEICVSLWMAHDSIPSDVKESTYVYRIALNRAISWQRKRANYVKHLNSFFAAPRAVPVASGRADSELEDLYEAIRGLPEFDRSLVLLHLERRSYAEMADILGITETAVGKRLSRAKQRISEVLREDESQ